MDVKARKAVNSGHLAFDDQRWSDAVRHYERAIELSPVARTPAVYSDLGYALVQLGRWSEALFVLTRSIELDDRNAKVWVNRSHTYNRLRRFAEAVADASRALELDLKCALAVRNRLSALCSAGLHACALKDAQRWTVLKPNDLGVWALPAADPPAL